RRRCGCAGPHARAARPARGEVLKPRSATQDILGRGAEARVLRLRHARPPCRGWQSQRGRTGTRRRKVSRGSLIRSQLGLFAAANRACSFAALALPAAAGRSGVMRTEHARVRFATQDVLGRAPSLNRRTELPAHTWTHACAASPASTSPPPGEIAAASDAAALRVVP